MEFLIIIVDGVVIVFDLRYPHPMKIYHIPQDLTPILGSVSELSILWAMVPEVKN